jgi:protein CpxP
MSLKRLFILSAVPLVIGGLNFTLASKAVANQSLLVAQASSVPNGQQGGPEQAFANLGLTDAQKSKIQQIHESCRTQIEAVFTTEQKEQLRLAREQRQRPNLNLSEEQKTKMKAIREGVRSQIDAVLTAQQKQKLQQMHQQRRGGSPQGQS